LVSQIQGVSLAKIPAKGYLLFLAVDRRSNALEHLQGVSGGGLAGLQASGGGAIVGAHRSHGSLVSVHQIAKGKLR